MSSLPRIEDADCMVQAVISATGYAESLQKLRDLRHQQLVESGPTLDIEAERRNLLTLLAALHTSFSDVTLVMVTQLAELDAFLARGETVFVGLAAGPEASEPPHIVHVQEKYSQPQVIHPDGTAQFAFTGYRSPQEWTSTDELATKLMEQKTLPLFLLR